MCHTQKEFENGEVAFSDIRLGSTAHYTCSDGYTLVGPATRECLITGTWSGYTPVCVANNANGSKINSALKITSHVLLLLYNILCYIISLFK